MLEIVMPGIRRGEAKMNSSSAYRGHMCYIAGVDADGYQLLQVPYSTATAGRAYFPVNKLYFEEYYNDTSDSVDKIANGDQIIYYEGGEYITDRVCAPSFFGGLDNAASYWASIETLSSAEGHSMYYPGSSTAIAGGAGALVPCYVSTGLGGQFKLYGSTVFGVANQWGRDHHVAYAVGIYATDSATGIKVRFRVDKNMIHGAFANYLTD